ncbi:hypothetical protein Tco_0727444 [Tanacetum coccineum]|uniref:Uncharacterized protein n=1 Tax=Tanacetum coccineum TaxID=301880 RepID=A0ABQ4YIE4_9ASTR
MLKQNAPLGCLYDDDDEDGGARLEMGVVASSVWWQQVARGGEWVWGSNRSGGGECFWGWSEKSRRKSFPAVVAWRRRWFRWPVFLEGRERLGMKEEEAEAMAETMEQYMSKTRTDYGSGVARPKIKEKDSFELKG